MSPPDMQFQLWLVGMRNAMELMLTGDAISGAEAVRMGFANRSFPAEARVRHALGDLEPTWYGRQRPVGGARRPARARSAASAANGLGLQRDTLERRAETTGAVQVAPCGRAWLTRSPVCGSGRHFPRIRRPCRIRAS